MRETSRALRNRPGVVALAPAPTHHNMPSDRSMPPHGIPDAHSPECRLGCADGRLAVQNTKPRDGNPRTAGLYLPFVAASTGRMLHPRFRTQLGDVGLDPSPAPTLHRRSHLRTLPHEDPDGQPDAYRGNRQGCGGSDSNPHHGHTADRTHARGYASRGQMLNRPSEPPREALVHIQPPRVATDRSIPVTRHMHARVVQCPCADECLIRGRQRFA